MFLVYVIIFERKKTSESGLIMKKRMMLFNAAIVSIGFAIAFVLAAILVQNQYRQEFAKRLDATLAVMATQSDTILENPQKYTKLENRYLSEANQEMRITVLNSQGDVIGDSEQAGMDDDDTIVQNHLERPEIQQALKTGKGYDIRNSSSVDRPYYYGAVYIPDKCFVRAALPMNDLDRVIARLWLLALLSMAVGIALTCVLTWAFVCRFIRPIDKLSAAARKIADGDFTSRMQGEYRDEIGELSRSFNVMADNTELAVRQLRDKQEQLESVLQGMEDGVLAVDGENRILFLNGRAGELLDCDTLQLGEHLDGSLLIRSLSGMMKKAGTAEMNGPGDSHYLVYTAPIRHEGGGASLAVISDVTHIRRLEQLRSEFVANVTHELKTPLTSIRGSIELLKSADRDEETRRYFYDVLDIEAERLHHLIDDMLALSQIESGRDDPSVRRCNLREEIGKTVTRLLPTAEKAGITLTLEGEDTLFCNCSPTRLQQLFCNLIENGIKYNRLEGRVMVSIQMQRRMAVVRVKDTGIGIAQEHIPRLFERFYRVDASRSREIGGTGLGLSIVKHLAALYSGEVTVESVPGEGTTFTVRLPLA